MNMTSSRPYLIRALYEWIVDNNCTPHILIDALAEDVLVPQDYINSDGQLVLNISPSAIADYVIDNHKLFFRTRFGGLQTDISVPCHAVIGIYAKENKQGMIFDREPGFGPGPKDPPPSSPGKLSILQKKRPPLKVVK
ncbi:MAG: stringent starvation protein B [Cellvibrionaceae bacterium]|jgi:stringent starvation protein B